MSSRPDQASRFHDRGGFTLVETLVAFVVLSSILAVLFRGVVELRAGAQAFDTRSHAEIVARSLLGEAFQRRDQKVGTTSGLRDGRPWTISVTTLSLAAQLPPAPKDESEAERTDAERASDRDKPKWAPVRIVIKVETGGRPVMVETVQLAKGPSS